MPNPPPVRARATPVASAAEILGPLVDDTWQRGELTDAEVDAVFARLLPIAEMLDDAVVYRLQVAHVDQYGDPRQDAAIAARRCDLLIREQQARARQPARGAYERWLDVHRDGQEHQLRDRAAVLRHLVRTT
jgi:hypothetical protein